MCYLTASHASKPANEIYLILQCIATFQAMRSGRNSIVISQLTFISNQGTIWRHHRWSTIDEIAGRTIETQNTIDGIRSRQRSATAAVLAMNIAFFLIVVIIGFYANSLVLLASAVHLVADTASLAISYVAILLTSRPASRKHSFGLVRAEVLGALINGTVLLATSIWILVEAVRDLSHPHPVSPLPVVVLGVAGMVITSLSLIALNRSSGTSLNMRASVIHMAGDAAGWFVTMLSGLAIGVFDFYRADALGSIIISLIILISSWRLLSQTMSVLLESTPRDIRPEEIEKAIEADPQILNVHHVHLWNLASDTMALSAHVQMQDGATLHSAQIKTQQIKEMLKSHFGIDHATIEVECHICGDSKHTLER